MRSTRGSIADSLTLEVTPSFSGTDVDTGAGFGLHVGRQGGKIHITWEASNEDNVNGTILCQSAGDEDLSGSSSAVHRFEPQEESKLETRSLPTDRPTGGWKRGRDGEEGMRGRENRQRQ